MPHKLSEMPTADLVTALRATCRNTGHESVEARLLRDELVRRPRSDDPEIAHAQRLSGLIAEGLTIDDLREMNAAPATLKLARNLGIETPKWKFATTSIKPFRKNRRQNP